MSWPMVALGDVAQFVRGITYKPADVSVADDANAIPCMRTKNIQADLEDDDLVYIPATLAKPEKRLRQGDILVSSANSWNLVGKCSWVPELSYDATFGGFTSVLRTTDKQLSARYLYRWFSTERVQALARSFGQQTTNIANLNHARCLTLKIPLPPLPEQRRIAAILDKADALRRKRQRAIELLDSLTQSIFLEMFGPISGKGANWPVVTVGQAGRVQLGRQRAPKYQTGKFTRPYVRVANVYEDRIDTTDILSMDFDDRDFPEYVLHNGDILLNEGQSTELVGRPAMWRSEIPYCCFQNTLVRFQAEPSLVISEFAMGLFLHYFRSGEFSKVSSKTSNVAHLGASRFAKMPFPLPDIEAQVRYARASRKVRTLKSAANTEAARASSLFASLQSRAFAGEL